MTSLGSDLPRFIRKHITSVWDLEILLLLMRTSDVWATADIVRELRATTNLVSASLQRLTAGGLTTVQADGAHAYAPRAAGLYDACERLAEAYRERPVQVINIIAAPPDDLLKLADAFRFNPDGEA